MWREDKNGQNRRDGLCKHRKFVVSKHLMCNVIVLVSHTGARASSVREATGQKAVHF